MNDFELLKKQVEELMEWKRQRESQQITIPLDLASRAVIGGAQDAGAGSAALTQSVDVTSTPSSIDVPSAYAGTRIINIDGVRYEIPYIQII